MSSRCHEWFHFATRFCIGGLCVCVCVCVRLHSSPFQPRFMRFILGNCQPESSYCVRNFSAAAARLICSTQLFVTQISPVHDEMTQKYPFLIHLLTKLFWKIFPWELFISDLNEYSWSIEKGEWPWILVKCHKFAMF